jgi:hypothetical protein
MHHGYLYGWQLVSAQLAGADATTITVDGQTVSQTLAAVENRFAQPIAAGPTARTVRERQHLLRYANQVAVSHSLRSLARQQAPPDASKIIRTFDCECAAAACDALVDLSVSAAAALLTDSPPTLLAPGHDATQ